MVNCPKILDGITEPNPYLIESIVNEMKMLLAAQGHENIVHFYGVCMMGGLFKNLVNLEK